MTEPIQLMLIGIGLTLYSLYAFWQGQRSGSASLKYGRFSRDSEPGRYRLGMFANLLCAVIGAGLTFAGLYVQIYGEKP